MTLATLLLLLLAMSLEVIREVSFKRGATQTVAKAKKGHYLYRLFGTPVIWFGFFCWALQIAAWIIVLSRTPLSIAFPMMSLCYVGTTLAGKYILHETVRPRRWLGVCILTLGVAIVGAQGVG